MQEGVQLPKWRADAKLYWVKRGYPCGCRAGIDKAPSILSSIMLCGSLCVSAEISACSFGCRQHGLEARRKQPMFLVF